jgi:hypothetical protein
MTWADHWAFARVRLGLSKEEFFSLTPRLFAMLCKQYAAVRRETHTLVALLRTDIINFSQIHPRERILLDDLLPPENDDRPSTLPRRLSAKRRQRIADGIRAMFAHCVEKN